MVGWVVDTNLDKMASTGKQTLGRMSSGRTRYNVLQPLEAPTQLRPSARAHAVQFQRGSHRPQTPPPVLPPGELL